MGNLSKFGLCVLISPFMVILGKRAVFAFGNVSIIAFNGNFRQGYLISTFMVTFRQGGGVCIWARGGEEGAARLHARPAVRDRRWRVRRVRPGAPPMIIDNTHP